MHEIIFENTQPKAPQPMKRMKVILLVSLFLVAILVGSFFLLYPDQTETDRDIPLEVLGGVGGLAKEVILDIPNYDNLNLDVIFKEKGTQEQITRFNLNSHKSIDEKREVGTGSQRVQGYIINSNYGLVDALGIVEFTDMWTGELVERDWKYVYLNKITIFNQTTQQEEIVEEWLDYDSTNLPEGKIEIWIEVEVFSGDWIDGVWIIGGKRISKHAEWINTRNNIIDVTTAGVKILIGDGVTNPRGVVFFSNTTDYIVNATINLTGSTNPPTTCWLNKSTGESIAITTIVAGTCPIEVALEDDVKYILSADSNGSAYTYWYWNIGRNVDTDVTWANGWNGAIEVISTQILASFWIGEIVLPSISVSSLSPDNYTNFSVSDIPISWDATPSDIGIVVKNSTMNVTFHNGTLAYTTTNVSGIEGNYFATPSLSDINNYSWNSYAYGDDDVFYPSSNGTLIFSVDTTDPFIQYDLPTDPDGSLVARDWLTINTSAIDNNLGITSVDFDGVNATLTDTGGNYSWVNETALADGEHTFFAWVNDTLDHITSLETRVITIDTTNPLIEFADPTSVNGTITIEQNFTVNVSLTESNPGNITFTLFNETSVVNVSSFDMIEEYSNTTIYYEDLPYATYYYNVTTFDLVHHTNSTGTRVITIQPFIVDSEVYNPKAFETNNETFFTNITTDPAVTNIGVFLVYNGTNYAADHSCSAGLCDIERMIDIPLVTGDQAFENKTFYWQITLFGSFGTASASTEISQHNVSDIIFTSLSPGNAESVNFSISNESDLNLINADFDSTFDFWMGSGTVKDSYNYSGSGANYYEFYINQNETFIVDSFIDLENGTKRSYQFTGDLFTNETITRPLFLPFSDASTIIIDVKDQGLIPLQDITVNVSRFYPSLGVYLQVESGITDEFGQIVTKLVEDDTKYKFLFYDSNSTLLKTSELISITCRSTICIIPFIIEREYLYFEKYSNLELFSCDLSYSNVTNLFTYSWDDQREELATQRLEVKMANFSQSTILCNSTSTAIVSSMTCDTGGFTASYVAQAFRQSNSGVERRVICDLSDETNMPLNVVLGGSYATYGLEGLFWVFILLFSAIGVGVYDPKVGAILYGSGFIFFGIAGIIAFGLPVFFANTLLVALFIWAVRT